MAAQPPLQPEVLLHPLVAAQLPLLQGPGRTNQADLQQARRAALDGEGEGAGVVEASWSRSRSRSRAALVGKGEGEGGAGVRLQRQSLQPLRLMSRAALEVPTSKAGRPNQAGLQQARWAALVGGGEGAGVVEASRSRSRAALVGEGEGERGAGIRLKRQSLQSLCPTSSLQPRQ